MNNSCPVSVHLVPLCAVFQEGIQLEVRGYEDKVDPVFVERLLPPGVCVQDPVIFVYKISIYVRPSMNTPCSGYSRQMI